MSQDNVRAFRRGFEEFTETHAYRPETFHPEFVWDMSTFRGWPEQQTYAGFAGAQAFLAEWLEAFDDWAIEPEEYIEAGRDRIVVILRQRGRSKASGATIEMHFGQVWTVKDGLSIRMQMYASPAEALEAVGLPSFTGRRPGRKERRHR
jgi:ketosteroid isomerase-like protein